MKITDQRVIVLSRAEVKELLLKALLADNPDFECATPETSVELDIADECIVTLTPKPPMTVAKVRLHDGQLEVDIIPPLPRRTGFIGDP